MLKLNTNLPPFLHWKDGEVRLVGHRIDLYHVVDRARQGETPEMIAAFFPTLSLDEVRNVIAFYHARRTAVDEYVAQAAAALQRLRMRIRRE